MMAVNITFFPPARSTRDSIAITQWPKIRFFALQGQLVAPTLAKFGMEEFTPDFAKISAWVGRKPPKLKILRNFGIQMLGRGVSLAQFLHNFQRVAECFP